MGGTDIDGQDGGDELGDEVGYRLLEQAMKVLASMSHMDDFNPILNGTIDDDISGARYAKATMMRTKLWASYANKWVVG